MGNGQKNAPALMDASLALDCYLETLLTTRDAEAGCSMQAEEKLGGAADSLSDVPDWAQQPFGVLVFHVGKLEFFAPLQDVGGIEVMPEAHEITVTDSLPAWALGVAEIQQQRMAVINTPVILRSREQGLDGSEECYNVVIHASRKWALACGEIMGNETVSATDFCWSDCGDSNSQRPWVLGVHQARGAVLTSLRDLLPVKK